MKLIDKFCEEENIQESSQDVQMKIHLESPGTIRLICKTAKYLGLVGMGILFLNGGGLKCDHENLHISLCTDGLIENLSNFLDRKDVRKTNEMIRNSLNKLKVESPMIKDEMVLYQEQNEYNIEMNKSQNAIINEEGNSKGKVK